MIRFPRVNKSRVRIRLPWVNINIDIYKYPVRFTWVKSSQGKDRVTQGNLNLGRYDINMP